MTEGKLQWHPAFVAALHIEFEDELDVIEIEAEHQLGKKPMQMDALIVKKAGDTPVRKNIGQIFRRYNIIEYKSPDDCLSINDFYKVYAYSCIYQSDTEGVNEISPDELTITYVCNHYPRKMLKQLEHGRKLTITKKADGIYYLDGDEFPIQILITKELSKKDNYWLQSLRNNLKAGSEIEELAGRYESKKQNIYYQAVMDLIVRANQDEMEEAKYMCKAILELFADEYEELRRADEERMREHEERMREHEERMRAEEKRMQAEEKRMQAEAERMHAEAEKMKVEMREGMRQAREEGLEQGELRVKKIFKLFAAGTPVEFIAEKCGVTVEKVQQVLE